MSLYLDSKGRLMSSKRRRGRLHREVRSELACAVEGSEKHPSLLNDLLNGSGHVVNQHDGQELTFTVEAGVLNVWKQPASPQDREQAALLAERKGLNQIEVGCVECRVTYGYYSGDADAKCPGCDAAVANAAHPDGGLRSLSPSNLVDQRRLPLGEYLKLSNIFEAILLYGNDEDFLPKPIEGTTAEPVTPGAQAGQGTDPIRTTYSEPKVVQHPCPECGELIEIAVSRAGRITSRYPTYKAACAVCGFRIEVSWSGAKEQSKDNLRLQREAD